MILYLHAPHQKSRNKIKMAHDQGWVKKDFWFFPLFFLFLTTVPFLPTPPNPWVFWATIKVSSQFIKPKYSYGNLYRAWMQEIELYVRGINIFKAINNQAYSCFNCTCGIIPSPCFYPLLKLHIILYSFYLNLETIYMDRASFLRFIPHIQYLR